MRKIHQLMEDVNWGCRGERPRTVLKTFTCIKKANKAKREMYKSKGYTERQANGKFYVMSYDLS